MPALYEKSNNNLSVSVIIPTRNEEGNIEFILKRMPKLGIWTEIIFVEGHSTDNTWSMIKKCIKYNPIKLIRLYKQRGMGKADAVRLGILKAKGEIIIIFDGDLSIDPEELTKVFSIFAESKGIFVNGSRFVHSLEKGSMKFLNIFGNKIFSIILSWIIKQHITDTLCGIKAFLRKDYLKIRKVSQNYGNIDPFGDFELLFGAAGLNLRIVEIPLHYKARRYGESNINRFRDGLSLIKMCFYAFWTTKYIQ